MRRLVVLGVVAASGVAHADRTTVIDVGLTLGGAAKSTDASSDAKPLVGPRVTLAWEGALPDLPDQPGYRFGGALVPEIVAGSYIDSQRDVAEGYLGVGLRADLQLAQREQGLLKVSARGAFYAVGRALVIGNDRDPMYEVGVGEYLARFHSSTRFGLEFTFVDRPHDHGSAEAELGGFFGLYVGH